MRSHTESRVQRDWKLLFVSRSRAFFFLVLFFPFNSHLTWNSMRSRFRSIVSEIETGKTLTSSILDVAPVEKWTLRPTPLHFRRQKHMYQSKQRFLARLLQSSWVRIARFFLRDKTISRTKQYALMYEKTIIIIITYLFLLHATLRVFYTVISLSLIS